jgi:hypothetical protein
MTSEQRGPYQQGKVWPETDDPAVLAMVEHFVNEGFDPDGAEYVEIAMTALMGLYVAGFTVTPWPTPKENDHA